MPPLQIKGNDERLSDAWTGPVERDRQINILPICYLEIPPLVLEGGLEYAPDTLECKRG